MFILFIWFFFSCANLIFFFVHNFECSAFLGGPLVELMSVSHICVGFMDDLFFLHGDTMFDDVFLRRGLFRVLHWQGVCFSVHNGAEEMFVWKLWISAAF